MWCNMEENICLIRNKTCYNKKTYIELNNALFRNKFLICSIICLLLIGAGIYMVIAGFSKIFGIIYIAFGILAPIFFFVMFKISVNKVVKNSERLNGKDLIVHFDFYNNYIECSGDNEVGKFDRKLGYKDYYKYIETKDYFILIIDKGQAHIIDKNGFDSPSDIEDARKLLEKIKLVRKGKKS